MCDLLWADPLLEDVLSTKLSDKDYVEVCAKQHSMSKMNVNSVYWLVGHLLSYYQGYLLITFLSI